MSKATKKSTTPKITTKQTDDGLIRACITFAQSVAAYDASFTADPFDSQYAEKMVDDLVDRKGRALESISRLPAQSLRGLQAKVKVISFVVSEAIQSMDDLEEAFFLSLAADAKRLLAPIIADQWRAARLASKVAGGANA